MTWYEYLADASVRAVALAAMAGALTLFLRKSPAAEHAMWALVVIGMLALPALRLIVPAAYVYVVERPAPAATITRTAPLLADEADGASPVSPPARTPPAAPRLQWSVYAAMAYIAGVALFAVRLLVGLLLTRRLLRGARPIDAGVGAGVEESHQVRVPLTIGLKRARVLLPGDWREWPAEKLNLVLAHELAHARRHDPAISLLAAANKCIFWFHPLAWWLERRLAVLAEHAADDAGLAVSAGASSYARVLLDVASRMEGQPTRLIWNATAMNGQLVARRVRRVLDPRTKPGMRRLGGVGRATLLSSAALLIWISVAVDLQRVARAQAMPSAQDTEATWFGYRAAGWPLHTTTEQAAQMEQQLAANPEDEATRTKLLRYYWLVKMHDRRIPLVLWLIDHHPESAIHGYDFASIFTDEGSMGSFADLRSRWSSQVDLHPDDARVLGNAARALGQGSTPEEIDLMKRAQKLDPTHRTEPLAKLYSFLLILSAGRGALRTTMTGPVLGAEVRSELQESNDVALVGTVARDFVEAATQKVLVEDHHSDFAVLKAIATDLVTHAQALEPQNRDWADLMEGVKGMPRVPPQPTTPAQTVRIGAGVAAGMLLESPAPIYPPLAKMARIQGVVKLQVHIGTDGRVTETSVVSGHPLLVPAAMDAVRQYVYKPALVQGQAVEAMTTVEVPFGPDRE